jgi:hypothetical protein
MRAPDVSMSVVVKFSNIAQPSDMERPRLSPRQAGTPMLEQPRG